MLYVPCGQAFIVFWRSALAPVVMGDPSEAGHDEDASSKFLHGAYSFPLQCIFIKGQSPD